MFTLLVLLLTSLAKVQGLCGSNIRWSHSLDIDDVYGMWYGASYAQHTPDMTSKPKDIGCVTLYITDATTEVNSDWLDLSSYRRNYTDQNWRSPKSNPWSNTPMSGSWLDVRVKRTAVRRDKRAYDERRLRVVWDEDGQTMEQTYVYSPDEPGFWTAERWRPMEREMISRGIDVWFPDDPPRHPDIIRVLKATPELLIVNHCSESGDSGVFSLILRRSPTKVDRWQWYDFQRQFFSFDLPSVRRHVAVCAGAGAGCARVASVYLLAWVICYVQLL